MTISITLPYCFREVTSAHEANIEEAGPNLRYSDHPGSHLACNDMLV